MTDPAMPRAALPAALRPAAIAAVDRGGVVVRAPGRVNLIGEHTDYNDGLAMPAAVDLATWVALEPRHDATLAVQSVTIDRTACVTLDGPLTRAGDWSDYVVGVAWALREAGVAVTGATVTVYTDLPLGAGLSSSAALEVAVALALLHVAQVPMAPLDVARLCQRAENEFVGARCGLLDQIAVTHGRAGHVLRLDCRSLEVVAVPLPPAIRLVLCNSMTTHAHSTGGFNQRRAECEQAVALLRQQRPSLRSLRDLTWADGEAWRVELPEPLGRRVAHVLAENDRVVEMARALAGGDVATMGRCLAASHASLRDLYEVSTPNLDRLVEIAHGRPGVIGARMMGGGFGGCVIVLVDAAAVGSFREHVRDAYQRATGAVPDVFVCEPGDAAAVWNGPW
jgi:galactokinase